MEDIIKKTGRKQNQEFLRKLEKGKAENLARGRTHRKLSKAGF